MSKIAVFLAILIPSLAILWPTNSSGTDDPDTQRKALSAFEQPLLSELLRKGYSPKNAEIASRNLLDELVSCWNSNRNTSSIAKPKTVVVRLGGETIVTHGSVCLSEFLDNVDGLPSP